MKFKITVTAASKTNTEETMDVKKNNKVLLILRLNNSTSPCSCKEIELSSSQNIYNEYLNISEEFVNDFIESVGKSNIPDKTEFIVEIYIKNGLNSILFGTHSYDYYNLKDRAIKSDSFPDKPKDFEFENEFPFGSIAEFAKSLFE